MTATVQSFVLSGPGCPLPDSDYRFFTEERALDHFRRIVPLVERGIRPWDDNEVKAAGFEPLVLRAW